MIIKDSHPDVLIRKFDDKQVVDLLHDSSLVVKRVVDLATHVVMWIDDPNPPKAKTISAMLFRQIITFADATSELLRQGCLGACPPILRAQLEALLSLVYLNAEDSENRANAYQVAQMRDELRFAKRWLASSPIEENSDSDVTADGSGFDVKLHVEKVELMVEETKQRLASEDLSSVNEEWERTKRARKRRPSWYSLFDGPKDLRKLAEKTEMIDHYDKTYQYWSQSAHSTNVLANIVAAGKGRALVSKIRSPVQSASVATMCANMMLEATFGMISEYSPERISDLKTWYQKQMRKGFMRMATTNVSLDTDPRLTPHSTT